MDSCKVVGCNKVNIANELFLGERFEEKYWGYCLEHAEERKRMDMRLKRLEEEEEREEEEMDEDE